MSTTLWHTALSDGRIDVINVIASGDNVADRVDRSRDARWPFPTDDGDLPGTGRAIEFEMCTIAFIKDGKYALERHYFDMESLLAQFGAS